MKKHTLTIVLFLFGLFSLPVMASDLDQQLTHQKHLEKSTVKVDVDYPNCFHTNHLELKVNVEAYQQKERSYSLIASTHDDKHEISIDGFKNIAGSRILNPPIIM